jgi:hypothetical protein
MIRVATSLCACAMLAAAFASTATPARAISAELAKKCREMAIKAHPPAPVGTPYAAAERQYYLDCVAKGGKVEEKSTTPQK